MTLVLPGVDTLPPEPLRQTALSQWFTPQPLADRIARWAAQAVPLGQVLEPSAGSGVFVRAANAAGASSVTAVEIDPRYAEPLRSQHSPYRFSLRDVPQCEVCCGDYLAMLAPAEIYDTALMNPPYEGGLDGKFLAKAMDESRRVVALLRLDALGGKDRHERVWSQIGALLGVLAGNGYGLAGLVVLVKRPDFGGEHGAMGDYCVVDLRRGWTGDTRVEWWT